MSDVSHGVNASKTNNGAITPVSVDTGVHFVVGTAPVQMVNGKVNEVIMASSYKEAVQALGYSDDWKKYSLCEEIYTAFTLFNSAQVFFVNVLDPKKHKKCKKPPDAIFPIATVLLRPKDLRQCRRRRFPPKTYRESPAI